jgi:hypothetical protein
MLAFFFGTFPKAGIVVCKSHSRGIDMTKDGEFTTYGYWRINPYHNCAVATSIRQPRTIVKCRLLSLS